MNLSKTPTKPGIRISIADDHILLRNALVTLIDSFEDCKVINQCSDGREIIDTFLAGQVPDVVILDLNMPELNGYEVASWIRQKYPEVHILMLTMFDSELSLIRLLQYGVKGFLKKDVHPGELKHAIQAVVKNGFYYSNTTTGKLVNLFRSGKDGSLNVQKAILSDQEVHFLKLACTDLTYKEVAQRMNLNPRSIDSLRDGLFLKLDVRSRVGLAMLAVKHGIVTF